MCFRAMFFLCLDIYQLYFNCKFVRLSHSFIKGYLTWLDLVVHLHPMVKKYQFSHTHCWHGNGHHNLPAECWARA